MPLLLTEQLEVAPLSHPPDKDTPVGGGEYQVHEGDCIESIAARAGHFWKTIWDHPANAAVKSARQQHNLLLPGDLVHVPPREVGEVSCATDQRHNFVRRGIPCVLRLRLLQGGFARSNERYFLTVCGKVFDGTTGPDGEISVPIPAHASSARLAVGVGLHQRLYDLELGAMDPLDTTAGVQKRLQNLGYCGPAANSHPDALESAIASFQKDHGLAQTGVCDTQTRARLRQKHGS